MHDGETPAAIHDAIEGLYASFRHYPLRPVMEFCNHCVTPAQEARLHERPLRSLDAVALRRFAAKATTTWGDVADFKHFLPRIIELVTADRGMWPDMAALFHKLTYIGWRTWPDAERIALEGFAAAYWQAFAEELLDDVDRPTRAHDHAWYVWDFREVFAFRRGYDAADAVRELAALVNAVAERWRRLDESERDALRGNAAVFDALSWLEADGLIALDASVRAETSADADEERALDQLIEGLRGRHRAAIE